MPSDKSLSFVAVAFLLVLAPGAAHGQPFTESATTDPAAARSKGAEALKLYESGQWSEAFQKFSEAKALFHAPTLVLYMARCQSMRGRLVESANLYEQVLAERLPEQASNAFLEAQSSAKVELKLVRERIPKVTIAISDPAPGAVRLSMDGLAVPVGTIEVNPGAHVVEVVAANAAPMIQSFTIEEGRTETVRFTFPVAPVPRPRSSSALDPQNRREEGSMIPAYTAFGVGALGLCVGVVTGTLAINKMNELKGRCQGNICSIADKSEGDTVRMLGNISTGSWIVGGVGAAAGVVLLVLRPGGEEARVGTSEGGQAKGRAPAWSVGLGPAGVDVRGRF
jgi:hypothetical protein